MSLFQKAAFISLVVADFYVLAFKPFKKKLAKKFGEKLKALLPILIPLTNIYRIESVFAHFNSCVDHFIMI